MNLGRTFAAAVAGLLLSGCAAVAPQRLTATVNDLCLVLETVDGKPDRFTYSKTCADERKAALEEETKRLRIQILGNALVSTLDHLDSANKAAASAAIFEALATTEVDTPLSIQLKIALEKASITEKDLAKNKERWDSIVDLLETIRMSNLSAGEVREAIKKHNWIKNNCRMIGDAMICGQQEAPPPAPK